MISLRLIKQIKSDVVRKTNTFFHDKKPAVVRRVYSRVLKKTFFIVSVIETATDGCGAAMRYVKKKDVAADKLSALTQ